MKLNLTLTKKQKQFMDADADEVLYGGAAGGGKSFGQVVDALCYALRYSGSRQLILRRTYPELDKTLIRTAMALYPREIFHYSGTTRTGRFQNGSVIDFGYCDGESDVYRYQGGEYDVIRFDELTHFTEFQYLYLISRLRGTAPFPRCIKSSTNPGGVGHSWVKARFLDIGKAGERHETPHGSRLYLPATVRDNAFLMRQDPDYIKRLQNLPEKERKALLFGDWNLFEGVRFTAFSKERHVMSPMEIPRGWRRYRAIDYGLDRLACYWIAVDERGSSYVYREYCASNLIISEAASAILARSREEEIYCTLAPPDLWSRGQESGKSRALLFADAGLPLVKVSNDRAAGWSAIDELLRTDEETGAPRLRIFANCEELIACLPQLQIDKNRPDDVMTEPHNITHAPDALRYFAIFHARPAPADTRAPFKGRWREDMLEDYRHADAAAKKEMLALWGRPAR